jgi:hypothetical protein
MITRRTFAGMMAVGALGAALASCGHECLQLPCPQPLAITINVTGPAGGPVEDVTVQVTGAALATFHCNSICRIPGTAGTYTLDVSAPGFAPVRRTLVVQGTTPSCGCPTVVGQSVAIELVSASSLRHG